MSTGERDTRLLQAFLLESIYLLFGAFVFGYMAWLLYRSGAPRVLTDWLAPSTLQRPFHRNLRD